MERLCRQPCNALCTALDRIREERDQDGKGLDSVELKTALVIKGLLE